MIMYHLLNVFKNPQVNKYLVLILFIYFVQRQTEIPK